MKKKICFLALLAGLFWLTPDVLADWSAAKRITWTSGYSVTPAIAVDSSDIVHVVWEDHTPGLAEVYYKRSANGGTTWSAAKRITWTSGNSYDPQLAVDSSGTVHVVWSDPTPGSYEIYYRRSPDGGGTWDPTRRITWASSSSLAPTIAVDAGDNIHVVWCGLTPDNLEIYYKRSTDGGTTWSAARRITWTSGDSYNPVIAVDSSDNIHVVWYDYTPGDSEIYFKRSEDGGINWSNAQRITWTSGYSGYPTMAIDVNDTLQVVWEDETPGNMAIYYKRSADGGASWSDTQRITWTSGESSSAAIAAGPGDTIHVVWDDDTIASLEIYYKRSVDGGASWSATQRITWTSGESGEPAIALDSSNAIHAVWRDITPGNYEIYYKKGT